MATDTKAKNQAPKAPAASKALVYAPAENQTHVDALRVLIMEQGHSPKDVLEAYVDARLPEFMKRDAYKGKAEADVRKAVKRHGRTHLSLALATSNPAMVGEQVDRARATVARYEQGLANAKAKLASAEKVQSALAASKAS